MITKDWLLQYVVYCPETGLFRAKTKFADSIKEGQILGTKVRGYTTLIIKKKRILAHQAAFLIMEGRIPELIDHKDTNRLNNKWSNLREANKQTNGMNAKIRKDNSTGVKGISWEERANGFQARVAINRKSKTKRFSVNKYKNKDEALKAAEDWVKEIRLSLHGEFANHG